MARLVPSFVHNYLVRLEEGSSEYSIALAAVYRFCEWPRANLSSCATGLPPRCHTTFLHINSHSWEIY
jgi:hypothetical protein